MCETSESKKSMVQKIYLYAPFGGATKGNAYGMFNIFLYYVDDDIL